MISHAATTFDDWLSALDAEAAKHGCENLTKNTGRECWRVFFDDGYSPIAALTEDWSNR